MGGRRLGLCRVIRTLAWVSVTSLGTASTARALWHLARGASQADFAQLYLMGHMLRHTPGTSFYDWGAVSRHVGQMDPSQAVPAVVSNYPPLVALLFSPMAQLSYPAARAVWLACNISLTAGMLLLAWSVARSHRPGARWFSLYFLLLLPATSDTLTLGQINPLMALLLLATVAGAARRTRAGDAIGAAGLALAAAIRIWPLVLAGYFVGRKRYRIAAGGAAGALVLTLLGAAAGGTAATRDYFVQRMPLFAIDMTTSAYVNNQSIWGVAARLFLGGTTWGARLSPENIHPLDIIPLVRSNVLYGITVGLFLLGTACALGYVATRPPSGGLSATSPVPPGASGAARLEEQEGYWATVVGLLAVLPFSWNHYGFYLVAPLVVLLSDERQPIGRIMDLGLGCLLLALAHRFWAWYPPYALLFAFGFLAVVTVESALVLSVARAQSTARTVCAARRRMMR